jgi:glycolate oxidase FAD binding subunit
VRGEPEKLQETIRLAARSRRGLAIRGSGSKDFYGGPITGEKLETSRYCGIVEYEPGELVLTVRAGTPLAEVEAVTADAGQMLPFEPPRFGGGTIGGCVATGLSGPRRPYAGAVRDLVLGVRIINGTGEDLRFGGQVIKNVAGYDVSRLMVGAMGTLGVVLEVSFKVVPRPAAETTLRFDLPEAEAIETMNRWAGRPLPVSATAYRAGALMVRLSGAGAAVRAARDTLGGEIVADGETFWSALRDHTDDFFRTDKPLWRISLPPTTPPLDGAQPQLIEWGGALRWMVGEVDAKVLRAKIAALGGHVTLFRGGDKALGVFHPLPATLAKIHRRLKRAFDPHGILNPGRMDNIS